MATVLLMALFACATTQPASALPLHDHPMLSGIMSGTDGPAPAQPPQGYDIPGRNPDSKVPWDFFLGQAAHRLIAYVYGVNHPESRAFYNSEPITRILLDAKLGKASRLLPGEGNLRPDITDATLLIMFEIKPWNNAGLEDGRQEVLMYLTALNRAVVEMKRFSPGTNFGGEILVRFVQGQSIWRLEWKTTEPGVIQYRWTRSQERFASEAEAYNAGKWVEISEQEMKQYGGWMAKAVEGMVNRRESLVSFSGVVGIVIDTVGNVAVGLLSSAMLGRMGSRSAAPQAPGQGPRQGGAQVLKLPTPPPRAEPPVRLPAASGR